MEQIGTLVRRSWKSSSKLPAIRKMEEGISERRNRLFPNVVRVGKQEEKGFVSGAEPVVSACLALY